jgi:HEAT repeat protein
MSFPPHIEHALSMLNYGLTNDETEQQALVDAFTAQWGGTDEEALIRAVSASEEQQPYFALLALGHLSSALAHDVLLPLLENADEVARWAAALGLGAMHEPAALPALANMLAAFSPYSRAQHFWWPRRVPHLLATWAMPAVVPLLRTALGGAVQAENAEQARSLPLAHAEEQPDEDSYRTFQYQLVYALGCHRAFGALSGLPHLTPQWLDVARVQLVMGSLHGRFRLGPWAFSWTDMPELRHHVETVLETTFGLKDEERRQAMHAYEAAYGFGGPKTAAASEQ